MSSCIFYGWYIIKTTEDEKHEDKLKENFKPNSQPFIINNFTWNENRILEASIDLSSCINANENILSVGNNIKEWDGSGNINLHFFYTKSSNKLIIDFVNQDDPYTSVNNPKCEFIVYPGKDTINVKITNKGLFINKRLITNDWFESRFVNQIYNIGNNIQVGSTQGKTLSNAKYNYIKVYDGAIEIKFGPLPWVNKQADGINKQMAEESFDIYKQQIVANIDVASCDATNIVSLLDNYNDCTVDNSNNTSKAASVDYTIFQVGTDISKYGSIDDNNFNIYYDAISNNVSLDFVNNSAGNQKYQKVFTLDSSSYINLLIKNSYVSFNNVNIDNIGPYINPVLKHNKLQFGFIQGDGYISQALYKDIRIEDLPEEEQIEVINLPATDFEPSYKSKKWISIINNDNINNNRLLSYNLNIETDLSVLPQDDTTYYNVLSIGNDIFNFSDNLGNYNIHMYYKPSKNNLQVNYTGYRFAGTKYIREDISIDNNTDNNANNKILNIQLSYADGLTINNNHSTIITKDNVSYLFEKKELYIGSVEGNSRYEGKYSSLSFNK